ncbi:hypothetical protein [Streptomyces sp. NPDC001787]|uniref:hypothetical protein n=1 Tax=Streptomyces sp. NPDC001787 TaxID=3154523 RepID=UPI00332C5D70
MAYRYWCGECGFKTPWLGESQGEQRQMDHYAKRHPGIPPGGLVETGRKGMNGGCGCVQAVGVLILLLLIAAACRR